MIRISAIGVSRLRKAMYISMGLLALAVFAMSLLQVWVIYTAPDISGYGVVAADDQGLPPADQRGAFLVLQEKHNPLYPSNLLELLATTEPGVVDAKAGAHVLHEELKSVLVQSAALSEGSEYRVYRLGEANQEPMKTTRQPGGRVMIIEPADGQWKPGTYVVDIPSEGMFGGRLYYQFYIDAPK